MPYFKSRKQLLLATSIELSNKVSLIRNYRAKILCIQDDLIKRHVDFGKRWL